MKKMMKLMTARRMETICTRANTPSIAATNTSMYDKYRLYRVTIESVHDKSCRFGVDT